MYVKCIVRPHNDRVSALPNPKLQLPETLTMSELHVIVRRFLKLDSHQCIFLFRGNTVLQGSKTALELWRDEGCCEEPIHLTYGVQDAFG